MKNSDVRIEQDLCCQYVVEVWRNNKGWLQVSRHKYLSIAEKYKQQ